MVMIALPATTHGFLAPTDRFGGGGSCSGSSAARGLRGEMGGRSVIDDLIPILSDHPQYNLLFDRWRPDPDLITEYGERVNRVAQSIVRRKERFGPSEGTLDSNLRVLLSRARLSSGFLDLTFCITSRRQAGRERQIHHISLAHAA
jgi:hypothetical protein